MRRTLALAALASIHAIAIAIGAVAIGAVALAGTARAQETALDSLRAAARSAPRDYDAQLALGLALIEAGHYREASTTMTRAANLRRDDAVAQYQSVRVELAQHNYQRARSQCRAVERVARDSAISHVCMARAWIAWNRSARALDEANAALERAPNDYEALLALADAHRLRHSVAEAESAYQRAAAANPSAAEPHLGLGVLYAQSQRRADALRELRRADQLDGDDPDVDFELGRLLEGQDAVTHLTEAVANRPGWALAQAALGDALLASGQTDAAITQFRAAIQGDQHLAHAQAGLGLALTAAGNLEEAERTLTHALEQVPNDAESVMALGDVYARTHREEEAYEQYRHAADLDPRSAEPLVRAARLAVGQERPVLAQGFLQRVVGQHPNHAAALALMGDVARARHQTREARDYYQRALRGEGTFDRAAVERSLRELH
ncbi:MAG: tetratricopeptide repeat protein [Sandaracinaceae bacterium]